jgi:hypothetical protein
VASTQFSDLSAHLKHLGYAISRRIRLYGEEFEVVSDPFPEGRERHSDEEVCRRQREIHHQYLGPYFRELKRDKEKPNETIEKGE